MSFTIAHDYKNSKVAHMTGTGIVFILERIENLNDLLYKGDILNTDKIDMYRIYDILEEE